MIVILGAEQQEPYYCTVYATSLCPLILLQEFHHLEEPVIRKDRKQDLKEGKRRPSQPAVSYRL